MTIYAQAQSRRPYFFKTPQEQALETFLEKYKVRIKSVAHGIACTTQGRIHQDDAEQELKLELWQSLDRYDPAQSLSTYFMTRLNWKACKILRDATKKGRNLFHPTDFQGTNDDGENFNQEHLIAEAPIAEEALQAQQTLERVKAKVASSKGSMADVMRLAINPDEDFLRYCQNTGQEESNRTLSEYTGASASEVAMAFKVLRRWIEAE